MSLPELKQAAALITKASSILLIVPVKPSTDAFSSMLATYLALLKKSNLKVEAVSPSHVPKHLQFLPGSSQVTMNTRVEPSITIDIAGPEAVKAVEQEKLNGGVRLHVLLNQKTAITRDNVEVSVRLLPYDVIITFGASDLEQLGETFTKQADFFYNTPIINIDHKPDNESYGTVNIIDITFSSIAETTHEFLTSLDSTALDADIATNLYAGIVAATESFQKPTTSPHAFELAATLLQQKANKEVVIQNLVKTKPLPLLKLSGRIYARLRHDEYGQLFWSLLKASDFTDSGADISLISEAMHELTNNISGYNAAFLLYENSPTQYTTYLLLGKGLLKRKKEIQDQLQATKENGSLHVHIEAATLDQAESKALELVRSILP
jgi:nanoRNase/pAp phosphatase (c-di-AMP/oligoRNAs hydrolase)